MIRVTRSASAAEVDAVRQSAYLCVHVASRPSADVTWLQRGVYVMAMRRLSHQLNFYYYPPPPPPKKKERLTGLICCFSLFQTPERASAQTLEMKCILFWTGALAVTKKLTASLTVCESFPLLSFVIMSSVMRKETPMTSASFCVAASQSDASQYAMYD